VGTLRVEMRALGVVVLSALLVVSCMRSVVETTTTRAGATGSTVSATTTTRSVTTTRPVTTTSSTAATSATFQAEVREIDRTAAVRMTYSWHEGCPVGLDQLRLVHLSFYDFSGHVRTGELVVNADVADDVVTAFEMLFDARFPIERMELIDVYEGDDEASMRADNTAAFNCRFVEGTTTWSEHAYGRAIDINPLLNPWVRGAAVDPPEAERYGDRTLQVPGMIHDGDAVVEAFADIGWTWGGTWSSSKDYQHFSSTGR
jgi:hypothetical protein